MSPARVAGFVRIIGNRISRRNPSPSPFGGGLGWGPGPEKGVYSFLLRSSKIYTFNLIIKIHRYAFHPTTGECGIINPWTQNPATKSSRNRFTCTITDITSWTRPSSATQNMTGCSTNSRLVRTRQKTGQAGCCRQVHRRAEDRRPLRCPALP